jgi:hypothetical protein
LNGCEEEEKMSLKKAPNVLSVLLVIAATVLTLMLYGILLGNLFNGFSDDLKSNGNSKPQNSSTSLIFSNETSGYLNIRLARND